MGRESPMLTREKKLINYSETKSTNKERVSREHTPVHFVVVATPAMSIL